MRRRGPLAALLACGALLGCGEAERPAAEPGATAAPSVATASDSTGRTACDLITEAELEGILGVELEAARLTNRVAGIVSSCRWNLPGDAQRGVSMSLYERRTLDAYRAVPGSVAVTDLGDDATWSGQYGQLAVLRGERVVSIGILLTDPERAHAERIAQTALAQLQ